MAESRRTGRPARLCIRATLLGAALGIALARPTAAQTVRGRVVEAVTETPVGGAVVRLVDAEDRTLASVLSAPGGSFVLRAPAPAAYWLRLERIGYAPTRMGPYPLPAGEGTSVIARLPIAVVPLASLDVEVEARVLKLERVGFYQRRAQGLGRFLDRADIESRPARTAVDLLRGMAGLRVVMSGSYADVQTRGSFGLMQCRPAIYLDGAFVSGPRLRPTSFNLDDLRAPDLEALEVFPASSLPSQYQGPESACGVILFWTRRPG